MSWVAYTPFEGRWSFTLSTTPEQAQERLLIAISEARVLSIPVNNPIFAVVANQYDLAYWKYVKRRTDKVESK